MREPTVCHNDSTILNQTVNTSHQSITFYAQDQPDVRPIAQKELEIDTDTEESDTEADAYEVSKIISTDEVFKCLIPPDFLVIWIVYM